MRANRKKSHESTWRAQCKVLQPCRKNSHTSKIKMWKCNTVGINHSIQDTKTLLHSSLTSRIDYCNSLLYGLPILHLHKLQHVPNMQRPGSFVLLHVTATSHHYWIICIGCLLRSRFTSRCYFLHLNLYL